MSHQHLAREQRSQIQVLKWTISKSRLLRPLVSAQLPSVERYNEMNVAAAYAIASVIPDTELRADYIVPSVFNPKVATLVAEAVQQAAQQSGVARKRSKL